MTDTLSRIADLNDRCRPPHCRILITATCLAALPGDGGARGEILAQAAIMAAVRRYVFKPEDGPERARGELAFGGQVIRFAIDYYDRSLEWRSEDPADPLVTTRVMTIMFPQDD